jgi:uncharacterized membrane protein YphA (DoxX/SURF4 family)
MTMVEMTRSTALMTRPAPPAPPGAPGVTGVTGTVDPRHGTRRAGITAVVDRVVEANARFAPVLLRLAMALVFLWFGALKVAGVSPVEGLLAETLPFVDAAISVPVLGLVEILIGLALAVGRLPRIVLLILAGHLAGTFLTFVTAAERMFPGSNPLELTTEGEFVVKNVVFISAALLLIAVYGRRADAHER